MDWTQVCCDSDTNQGASVTMWKWGYPLVNVYKKLWKITIFNGKIHYFYGHVQ